MRSSSGEHPSPGELQDFLRGDRETGAAEEHLEAGCLVCVTRASEAVRASSSLGAAVRAWARALYQGNDEAVVGALAGAIAGEVAAWARAIAYEERVAPALLEELLALPSPARRSSIRERGQFRTLGFARHLTRAAREEVFTDVDRAVELGELAVEAAELLAGAGYTPGQAADALSLAWGALANAHRVSTDLPQADRAMRQAWIALREGSGDPLVAAELLSLEGSLRTSQARFEEAREVLEEAVVLFERHGEAAEQVRVLAQLGKALGDGGDVEDAVAVLDRAWSLASDLEQGRLFLYVLHLRSAYLAEAGRIQEARAVFEKLAPLWEEHAPGVPNRLRLLWLDARISWGEGDLAIAECKLLEVRDGWEERQEAYEVALVSLDLAVLLLEQRRTQEVKRLASAMLPIFGAQDVHRYALAALALVQRSVETEEATASSLREVARYLRHARHNPFLRYPGLD